MSNEQTEPPLVDPDKIMFWFILSIIIFVIALGFAFRTARVESEKIEYNLNSYFLKAENPPIIYTEFLEGMYLVSKAPPFGITGEVRGTLIDKIIRCESNWDPLVCNKEFGCRAGMGLCGFISGTWNTTLDKMKKVGAYMPERCWRKVKLPVSQERTEAVFDAVCNRLAGEWLLENEGSGHWGTAETDWGSHLCWSK